MITTTMPQDEYRAIPKHSASVLKRVCDTSPKHALTPSKSTKATDEGLMVHEFILERELFLSKYVCGINPDDYPDALTSVDQLKAEIDGINETRLPKLALTGNLESLIEQVMHDSPDHLAHVSDISKINTSEIKKLIKQINSAPNRGVLSKSGSSSDLYQRLVDNGWKGQYLPEIEKKHAIANEPRVALPYDEYTKYEEMYASLINHLEVGARYEIERNQDEYLFQWLLYAFTTPDVMEKEVSMIGNEDKCRMDMMFKAGDHWYAFDIKKTKDASEDGFFKQAARYNYDLQAVHYSTVSNEVGRPLQTFGFIAMEPFPPYAVNVLIPNNEFIEIGHKKRAYSKKLLTEWQNKGDNTAYEPRAKVLTAAPWSSYGKWMDE